MTGPVGTWVCRRGEGWRIETVRADLGDGPEVVLEVSRDHEVIAYCRTIAEVASYLDPSELVPAPTEPSRRAATPARFQAAS